MNKENKEISEQTNGKHEAKKVSGIAAISFFIAIFDKLGEIIYNAIANGFFGRCFSAYTRLQQAFVNSLLGKLLFGKNKFRRFFRKIRGFFANNIESGFFVSKTRDSIKYFCSIPLGSYGSFFLFFGIYSVVVYALKALLPILGVAKWNDLVVGIIIIIVSFPLTFSRIPLIKSVKDSAIGRLIFQGAFGISDNSFEINLSTNVKKHKGNYMFFLGLFAGALTFFVSPLTVVGAIFGVIALGLIAVTPEIGVLISIAGLPFLSFSGYPTLILCIVVCVTAFCYLLKVLRGKRVFKFEIVDAFVLLFGICILLSGIFSAGGAISTMSSISTFVLLVGYFLVVNMMRTEKWVQKCTFALIGSATVVAIIGILEYFLNEPSNNWLDLSLFSDIKIRVVSLFDNPNILASFLVMVFPFALASMFAQKNKNEKTLAFIVCVILATCVVFTWSRGAWLALIFATMLFLFMHIKKFFRIFGVAILSVPILILVLPDIVLRRFLSIVNLFDSSISYRIYTWRGTLKMIGDYWFQGVGYGNEAFSKVYPNYAYSGMESAAHSHSLFLQIIATMGVFALVIFAIAVFLNVQKCFEYTKNPQNKSSKIYVFATICSLAASLVMGMFDYIWYNPRVFYIFWVILAIGCAFVRSGNYEMARTSDEVYENNVVEKRDSK